MTEEPKYILPHDSSNALIAPAKKSKKEKEDERAKAKIKQKLKPVLSKKKQKELKKVLERKNKRFTRKEVLEKLSKNQISQDEINMFTPVARMQEKATKRKYVENEESTNVPTRNSIAGSQRKKFQRMSNGFSIPASATNGPYFETDSSSSSDEENDTEIRQYADEEKPIDKQPFFETVSIEKEQYVANTQIAIDPKDMHEPKPLKKNRPTINVPVFRSEKIQEDRLKLPILAMEQEIMETINESSVVVVCGETGSGKTTQVPQFLYEAGYCTENSIIGITEPRRVAAMSMSMRVAEEMNLSSNVVSYQIRYEGNVGDETKIKFMTDGVLLKELRDDFLLSKYSVIIIDEAHERSMYSDILIGLLSRVVILREKRQMPSLKLIIMSATLRIDDFLSPNLFKIRPNVIRVEARQFPVTMYFNRKTEDNYLLDAYKKCCKIHRRLPDGGILVFVSGQREVHTLVSWLMETFPASGSGKIVNGEESKKNLKKMRNRIKAEKKTGRKHASISLDSYKIEEFDVNDADAADFDMFDAENEETFDERMDSRLDPVDDHPMFCLPLYSLMDSKKQARVFEAPPIGQRLCVVATNVAETSLTIPGVKYVVDTGKEKVRSFDGVTGVSKFVVKWISKASAEQRTGRAGRTCPGKCYRLYSSAVFTEFEQFSAPEILSRPIDELVLLMKNMNILKVINFPFPTRPDVDVLRAAEERLINLGALQRDKSRTTYDHAKITPLGRTMASFPVSPAFAKVLTLAHQENLLPYVICLVAALSVREPMINLTSLKEKDADETISHHLQIRRELAGTGEQFLLGDLMVLLRVALDVDRFGYGRSFCSKLGLRQKAMVEIQKMRRQLTKVVKGVYPDVVLATDGMSTLPLPLPTVEQTILLRQIFLAGLMENVARKRSALETTNDKTLKNSYECLSRMKDSVFIHPTSVLRRRPPNFVVYQEIIDGSKKYMQSVMAVEEDWVKAICGTQF